MFSKKVMIFCIALAGSMLLPPLASAGDVQLQEVVVTATKTEKQPQDVTQSVTVITADEIKKSGADTVGGVIQTTVGATVDDQGPLGSLTSIKLRGSSYQQVLVLLDGVRMNSMRDGGFDLSELPVPLEDIERIEIVRGPASSLYGSDAVGGVVNIITKKPSEPSTTLGGAIGEHGFGNILLTNTGKDGNLLYRLTANKEHSAGYRVNSRLDKGDGSLKLEYAVGPGSSVNLTTDYIEKKIGVPGRSFAPSPNANQFTRDFTNAFGLSTKFSKDTDLKIHAYEKQGRLHYEDPDWATNSTHDTVSRSADMQIDWLLGSWSLITLGAESRRDALDSTETGHHAATLEASYIQDEINVGDALILVFGGRNDKHSLYGSQWSPKASGRYLFASTGTILRASYGKSFRAPTFNDLFWPYSNYPFTDPATGVTTNYVTQGNPNLLPEKAEEFEGGIEQPFGKGAMVKFTAFRRKVRNLIKWQEIITNPTPSTVNDQFQPENIGRARISGYEAEIRLALSDSVLWSVNYTRLFPVDEQTGARITSDASPTADMRIGSTLTAALDSQTNLGLDGQWVKNYVAPGAPRWRYYVVNGKISQTLANDKDMKTDIYLGVKNLFNRTYEEAKGYPMPPQEVYGGLSVRF